MNAKQKGGAMERKICKALSRWLTNGKREDCLWRSAMSGGRATVTKGKVRQAGDVTSVSPEGHALTDRYFIEIKHVKRLDLGQFITHRKGILAGYWKKAKREADKYEREPMIIACQNRMPTIVLTRSRVIRLWVNPVARLRDADISLFSEWMRNRYHAHPVD